MNEHINRTNDPDGGHESTYALLIRSEERGRNLFELVVYPLLILGPFLAIWQFAQQPVNIPVAGSKAWIVFDASAQNNVWRNEFHTLAGDRHPNIQG